MCAVKSNSGEKAVKKLMVSFLLLLVFCTSSLLVVEAAFVVGAEKEPTYREQHGITLSFPTLNDNIWDSSGSFENSIYHWSVPDGQDIREDLFFHYLVWKGTENDAANFTSFAKSTFEKLIKQMYPDKKFGEFSAGTPSSENFKKKYTLQRIELNVYEQKEKITPASDPGEEPLKELVVGQQFLGTAWSIVDSKAHVQYVFMGTGKQGPFESASGIYATIVKTFYNGKDSNVGLVIMLLLGIIILVALVAGYVVTENKKQAERKRRLSKLQEDEYDDYDDYDDGYDDDLR